MKHRYFILHKPVGVICSRTDSQVTNIIVRKEDPRYGQQRGGTARMTVYDMVENKDFPTDIGLVGRLDMDTSGIMLLTDDTRLADAVRDPPDPGVGLEHSPFKCKEYEMTLLGERLSPLTDLAALAAELSVPFSFHRHGVEYHTSTADVQITAHWRDEAFSFGQPQLGWCISIRVVIREGKHHQLRRMARRSSLHVVRLHRSIIASILHASSVLSGECRWLTENEVRILYVGLQLGEVPLSDSIELH
eukprot:gene704-1348_t